MIPGETCCPACGSPEGVSKAAAWDAAATVPPHTADRLRVLEKIAEAAKMVVHGAGHPGDENTVVMTVPVHLLEKLKASISA